MAITSIAALIDWTIFFFFSRPAPTGQVTPVPARPQ
jgi:hypothetical protein